MNYRPDPTKLLLWDNWMFPDPDGRRIHLFFLANLPDRPWEWVGHAVSSDFVHWEELPAIQLCRSQDSSDANPFGSGMVFAVPQGGYMMSYTTNLKGPAQGIAFLHSDDLLHWRKCQSEPQIMACPPYYQTDAKECVTDPPAFRDAFVHQSSDAWEALISAHSVSGPMQSRGCIARYRSDDPVLGQWQAMPPLFGPGITLQMEVPEPFQYGSKHYLIWSTGGFAGRPCHVPSRGNSTGTYYAMSDRYEGPYECPPDNLLIGAGWNIDTPTSPERFHGYVGRVIQWNNEFLLYHHYCYPCPAAAFPKRIIQHHDGTLTCGYWPGIEACHQERIDLRLNQAATKDAHFCLGKWQASRTSLHGSVEEGQSIHLLPGDLPSDIHLRCRVVNESARRFGITMRDLAGGQTLSRGVAIQADVSKNMWQFGMPYRRDCCDILPIETISQPIEEQISCQLDIIVRDVYFEAYVNGVWQFSRIIHEHSRKGSIGFFLDNGSARFEQIEAWALEPIIHPFRE